MKTPRRRRACLELLPAILALSLGACSPTQVRYQPVGEIATLTDAPEATIFLLGDGGEASAGRDDVLAHLTERVDGIAREAADRPIVAVYLGDNIYDVGARADFEDEDLAKLTAQVQPLGLSPNVRAFFLPGNHDWAKGADFREGRTALEIQQNWLARTSGGRDVRLLPDDLCPGPASVDVGRSIHLVFIDTEWLLREPEDDCGSPSDFYDRLRGHLEANRGKRIVVLSHHPMVTGGPHGGNVAPFEHGPLVYYLAVKTGVSIQDLASGAYTAMLHELRATFESSGNVPLVHAAGHDHSLQVIRMEGEGSPTYQLVSGAASKTSNARRIEGTRYATNGYGYMQLDFYPDRAHLIVFARDVDEGPVRAVFTCALTSDGLDRECPEAPLVESPR